MPAAKTPKAPKPPEWEDEGVEPAEVIGQVRDIPEEEEAPIMALVPQSESTHHLVVGMGTLAAMSEEEFNAKLGVMQKGQERIRIIQDKLLTRGEDYGTVSGIKRPFLHQPGAEKLANFYGFALRQELKRVTGDGVLAPHLSYETTTFVHLGDFDGPIIAQGFGEANSWEEKHRWRTGKAICPRCGREGMIRGKPDGKLQGKWWCPGREGGCNATIEPAATNPDGSLQVTAAGKVENDDPYSLAETLVQMSAKRSMVAGVRRATGTSGLFTQDEDSPSVLAQVGDQPEGQAPVVEAASSVGIQVGVGAKSEQPTETQVARLAMLSKEKGLNATKIASLLEHVLGIEVEPTGKAVTAAVKGLSGEQIGNLIMTVETGEVPPTLQEATPGDPPQQADER